MKRIIKNCSGEIKKRWKHSTLSLTHSKSVSTPIEMVYQLELLQPYYRLLLPFSFLSKYQHQKPLDWSSLTGFEHEHNPGGLSTNVPAKCNYQTSYVRLASVLNQPPSPKKEEVLFSNEQVLRITKTTIKGAHTCSRMNAVFSVFAMAPKVSTCRAW